MRKQREVNIEAETPVRTHFHWNSGDGDLDESWEGVKLSELGYILK